MIRISNAPSSRVVLRQGPGEQAYESGSESRFHAARPSQGAIAGRRRPSMLEVIRAPIAHMRRTAQVCLRCEPWHIVYLRARAEQSQCLAQCLSCMTGAGEEGSRSQDTHCFYRTTTCANKENQLQPSERLPELNACRRCRKASPRYPLACHLRVTSLF
jgi:hypothetical protein